jgi:hypothetical protein
MRGCIGRPCDPIDRVREGSPIRAHACLLYAAPAVRAAQVYTGALHERVRARARVGMSVCLSVCVRVRGAYACLCRRGYCWPFPDACAWFALCTSVRVLMRARRHAYVRAGRHGHNFARPQASHVVVPCSWRGGSVCQLCVETEWMSRCDLCAAACAGDDCLRTNRSGVCGLLRLEALPAGLSR